MKTVAAALVACLPALAAPAMAADLPARHEAFSPPPPIPAFSWGGFYAGVQIGYAFNTDRTTLNQGPTTLSVGGTAASPGTAGSVVGLGAAGASSATTSSASSGTAGILGGTTGAATGTTTVAGTPGTPGTQATTVVVFPPPLQQSFGADGVIGGGHIGYNVVTRPVSGFTGVFGFEGDVDGSNYRKPVTGIIYGNGFTGYPFSGSVGGVDVGVQGSVRGRAGVAFDRLLLYATGGVAFADITSNVVFLDDNTFQHTRVGYTVGGGIEYAILNNVAVRVEYRYSDFGSFTDPLAAPGLQNATIQHRETIQRAQAGVSYLFATPVAPVVARY